MPITEVHNIQFRDGDRATALRVDQFGQLTRVIDIFDSLQHPGRDAIYDLVKALFPKLTPDEVALITDEVMDPSNTTEWLQIAKRNKHA
ncbi:MAG: hypothetical protein VBE63_08385 [Lamprobacter sp.]|uniref:hypothetical protein n=1 Tax=Lamprobacter sp. TaxID=3100796 RepID=UPI002B262400|nr:hypothetical protein [Lamprobacter sp.]MEA3639947.1 hypothetical protein [Lamprobacter sp.]